MTKWRYARFNLDNVHDANLENEASDTAAVDNETVATDDDEDDDDDDDVKCFFVDIPLKIEEYKW